MALDIQKITTELSYFGKVEFIEEDENAGRFILVMSGISTTTLNRLISVNNVLLRFVFQTYMNVVSYTYLKDDLKVQMSKFQSIESPN